MRLKIALVITSIIMVMTLFGVIMGMRFMWRHMFATIENDMALVGDITEDLLSNEIEYEKHSLSHLASMLDTAEGEPAASRVLESAAFPGRKWQSVSLVRSDGTSITIGERRPPEGFLDSEYARRAISGDVAISTTEPAWDGELVFWMCAPSRGGVLAAAYPSNWLSDIVTRFRIWDTGNIFVVDKSGTMIASRNPDLVKSRRNFIEMSKTDASFLSAGQFFEQMIASTGEGRGRYVLNNIERLCSYSMVESTEGWCLGIASPLSESPLKNLIHGMILAGMVFLGLGMIAAIASSQYLARPFEQARSQNAQLAELMKAVESASEAKSNFLANMSHEMRTPLNAIIGLSELTMDTSCCSCAKHEAAENLEKIYDAGITLLSIINDILDISKIESGKFELVPVEYDVPSMVNDTVSLNSMRIAEKPIKFRIDVDENIPDKLFGDELRVKQIFNNLLSNAFKYTQEGFVRWSLTHEADGEFVWLVSSVSDSGIGIRGRDIEKLFTNYNQVDVKKNRAVEGTGLGLSITKKLADMMEGFITVESEYGKGSTFTVRIRQTLASDTPIGKEVAENLQNFSYSSNKRTRNSKFVRISLPYARVLVVDDVKTNLDVARGMLKPYGMKIDCVTNGPQAIGLIKAGEPRYSAIFMDHMMPGMDGIEAALAIRELGGEYALGIPIIALTANALVGNEEMFEANGFQAFIPKPIDLNRLDQIIRQWVRDKDIEAHYVEGDHAAKPHSSLERYGIEGLDVGRAFTRFGEDENTLLQVLRSYAENTPALLEQADEYERGGMMAKYATVVHGIKGSSFGIAAQEAGRLAENLERAAKNGDLEFVRARHGTFMDETRRLIASISSMLGDIDGAAAKPTRNAPDPAVLVKLREACLNFSMDDVDAAMEELESHEYESGGDFVKWLRKQVNAVEFSGVADALKDL